MNADAPAPGKRPERPIKKSPDEVVAVVQCNGFRCMARRDAKNVWRDFHTGKELPDVQEVVFLIGA